MYGKLILCATAGISENYKHRSLLAMPLIQYACQVKGSKGIGSHVAELPRLIELRRIFLVLMAIVLLDKRILNWTAKLHFS